MKEFGDIAEVQAYPDALDKVIDYCVMGMDTFGPGDTRVSELCDECAEPLNKGFAGFDFEALKRGAESGNSADSPSQATLEICIFCNQWVHRGCHYDHISKHVRKVLCKGFRKDRQRAEELSRHIAKTDPSEGAQEPPAGHENFQRYRSDPITSKEFDPITARACLQTASSDEEQLDPLDYCSFCGSSACFRKPATCKEEERLVLAELIYAGWIGTHAFAPSVRESVALDEQIKLEGDISLMRLERLRSTGGKPG